MRGMERQGGVEVTRKLHEGRVAGQVTFGMQGVRAFP